MNDITTDVLIVGAGPTGLMMANQLARFDINFTIIDLKDGPTVESRAIAVTARSMEIYQQMGLADEVLSNGKRMESFSLYRNGKAKAEVKIGEIGKGLTDFSYMLAFEQYKNESLLYKHLQAQGKEVMWQTKFIELKEYKEKVIALAEKDGDKFEIKAKYVVSCEGARSIVRRQLDFSFKGGTYEQKFFVADAKVDWKEGYNKLIISPSQYNFCAFMPLSGDENYRIIGTIPRKLNKVQELTFDHLSEVVKKTMKIPMEFKEVNWFATYKLHHRAVDHFSEDRVYLAGDAAHIHSPAGGQGMNTGLQDAYNLAWKMAFVLKGQSPEKLLNTYDEERMPFAKWLLKFTDRGFTLMSSTNWFYRFARKFIALPLAARMFKNSKVRPRIFKTVSQTGYSYVDANMSIDASDDELLFDAGDRFPYFQDDNLHLKMKSAGFSMVHIHSSPMTDEQKDILKASFHLPIEVIEDQNTEKWKALGVVNEMFILVRPDNYIAFISNEVEEKQMSEYLEKVGLK
ncbi:FAD-dependent monooxygenase [Paracrocinitomix mangrovi]|uniref:FAD-dependent monooxygenase n=1 Tax=Paracrocinitomix mangrovi TaxID=2862509 RepID=UPI001C8EE070|nr:FAD-dependent monooxygenase [Paracrocinitomix mangrovi]UKN02752.1 FAD-dependent monooxygenase [Paracrocinitomix mangrovi]